MQFRKIKAVFIQQVIYLMFIKLYFDEELSNFRLLFQSPVHFGWIILFWDV